MNSLAGEVQHINTCTPLIKGQCSSPSLFLFLAAAAALEEAGTPTLLAWVASGEDCQLEDLRTSCAAQLAHRLVGLCETAHLPAVLADVELLEGCSKRTLLDILGLGLTAAVRMLWGSFEWTLEGFSQQPSAVEQAVLSPWFAAAGRDWRFAVYPGGCSQPAAGYISGKCNFATPLFFFLIFDFPP